MSNHSLSKLGATVFKDKSALKTKISITLQGLFVLLLLFLTPLVSAQNFQRNHGSTVTNAYTKVIQDGANYYVLGTENPTGARGDDHATVSRVDANGTWLWTNRLVPTSVLHDAIVTPTGNLLVVGESFNGAVNQSLFGLITPAGSFTWTKSYDYLNQETVNKIVRNPVPNNATFPFYAVGKHSTATGISNVVLFNLNEAGTFNWKKHYATTDVGDFANDLEALPNGDMLICGKRGTSGVIYKMNNAGTLTGGLLNSTFTNRDMATLANGSIYLVSTNGAGVPHLSKFNATFIPTWERSLAGLSAISQVAVDPITSEIIVTGRRTIGTVSRVVICRFSDVNNVVTLLSVKYLDNGETAFLGGATTVLSNGKLAFADGRVPVVGGLGGYDGFMSVSELDMTTSCMTKQSPFTIAPLTAGYESPVLPLVNFFDLITPTTFTGQTVAWQQAGACACVPPNLTATNPASVCAPSTINLTSIVVADANNITNSLTYHSTAADAVTGANPLSNLVISTVGTTTIWIRKLGSTAACYDTVSVVLTIRPKPVIRDGSSSICAGASVNLTNLVLVSGDPLVNFIWHQGSITGPVVSSTVTPSVSTTYFIEGQNSSGCRDTAEVVITVNPKPNAGFDVSLACTGGVAPTTYNLGITGIWSVLQPAPAAATVSTAGLAANMTVSGSYSFVLTTPEGCRDTVRVIVPTCACITPNLSASNPQPVCAPSTVTLTNIVVTDLSGVNNPVTYHATAANAVTGASPLTGPNLIISAIGTTTIWIRKVGSALPCYDTVSVQITINPKPVYADIPVRICAGETLNLTTLYPSSFSQIWLLNGNTVANPSAVSPTVSTNYTFIGQNASGCKDTAVVFVSVGPKPNYPDGATTICAGASVNLTSFIPNYAQIFQPTWTQGNNIPVPNPTAVTPSVTTTYTFVGQNDFGCKDTARVVVTVNPKPVFTDGLKVICLGESVDLNSLVTSTLPPITNAVWHQNSPTGLIITPPVTPSVTTTYFLTGESSAGCKDTAQVVVTVNPKPNAGNDVNLTCTGGVAPTTHNFNITGNWSSLSPPATITTTGAVANMTVPGAYFFVLRLGECSDTVRISVPRCNCISPVLSAVNPAPVCEPNSINLANIVVTDANNVSNNLTYHTTAGDAATGANPLSNLSISTVGTTTIWIRKVGSALPCFDTISVQITIYLKPVFPDAFLIRVCPGTVFRRSGSARSG